jgi:hypothetical protein
MRMRVIHFVPDVPKAERFYEALGLRADVRSRTGTWVEFIAAGGELDLHDSASAADGEGGDGFALNFVADEPLEAVIRSTPEAEAKFGEWVVTTTWVLSPDSLSRYRISRS